MYINEAAPAMVQPLLFCRSSRNRKKVRGVGKFVTTQVVVCRLGALFGAPRRLPLRGRVFKNSHQNLLKKVSILSAFRLLIFNTFKVKIVL